MRPNASGQAPLLADFFADTSIFKDFHFLAAPGFLPVLLHVASWWLASLLYHLLSFAFPVLPCRLLAILLLVNEIPRIVLFFMIFCYVRFLPLFPFTLLITFLFFLQIAALNVRIYTYVYVLDILLCSVTVRSILPLMCVNLLQAVYHCCSPCWFYSPYPLTLL